MCGLIRIDVKPGARRGSSKRLRRLSDAQGSEARVHGMDGLSATRDPRAGWGFVSPPSSPHHRRRSDQTVHPSDAACKRGL